MLGRAAFHVTSPASPATGPLRQRQHRDEGSERQQRRPELGEAQPLGEGADADMLEPGAGRRPIRVTGPCSARDRRQQAGEVDGRQDGERSAVAKIAATWRADEGRDQQRRSRWSRSRRAARRASARRSCPSPARRRRSTAMQHQQQKLTMHHGDIGQLLAEQEFEAGDRRRVEIGDRAQSPSRARRRPPSSSPGSAASISMITPGTMA